MEIKVNDKYEIVVPDGLRDKLKAGQRFKVVIDGGEIKLIPLRPAKELRGIFRGMNGGGYREEEERI